MTECGNVVIIAKHILTLAGMIEDRNYYFIKKQRHSSERWNPVTVDTELIVLKKISSVSHY
ncbi:MAG: hypothetical protein WCO92_03985 [Verrucomicrobiota bacterium]